MPDGQGHRAETPQWLGPAQRADRWQSIGAPKRIVDAVRDGVPVTWARHPPPPFDHGDSLRKASAEEKVFFAAERRRLLASGAWEVAKKRRFVSQAFLVPKVGSKAFRLVIDLRWLNSFCPPAGAEVEGLRELRTLAERNDWMVSVDLSDAYYHFRIREEDKEYFQFAVGGEVFNLRGLSFGSSHSPKVFTDILGCVVAHLRSGGAKRRMRAFGATAKPQWRSLSVLGAKLLWYLDDFLLLASSPEEARALRDEAVHLFRWLGLTLQEEKCVWEPTQRIKHLGLIIDTQAGQFQVDPDKLKKLSRMATGLLKTAARNQRRVLKRDVARFVGLCNFVHLAVRPARFHTRELHDVMATLDGWSGKVALSKQAKRDLEWWRDLPPAWNGCWIWRPVETKSLWTDSSDFAWGATMGGDRRHDAQGFWRRGEEISAHITLKELRAVTRAIECFAPQLAGHHVRHFEDNQAVVHIINNVTTRSPEIMRELRSLWWLLEHHGITLLTEYIPTNDNVRADELSRQELSDWALSSDIFELVGGASRHSIDRFASDTDHLLLRFNSRYACPSTEGVDALSQSDASWRRERNWVNPPWSLLDRVALKLRRSGAAATVAAPVWPRAMWYQMLQRMAERVLVVPGSRAYVPSNATGERRRRGMPQWDVALFDVPLRAPERGWQPRHRDRSSPLPTLEE